MLSLRSSTTCFTNKLGICSECQVVHIEDGGIYLTKCWHEQTQFSADVNSSYTLIFITKWSPECPLQWLAGSLLLVYVLKRKVATARVWKRHSICTTWLITASIVKVHISTSFTSACTFLNGCLAWKLQESGSDSIYTNEVHFTTKHVRHVHMLAAYLINMEEGQERSQYTAEANKADDWHYMDEGWTLRTVA